MAASTREIKKLIDSGDLCRPFRSHFPLRKTEYTNWNWN